MLPGPHAESRRWPRECGMIGERLESQHNLPWVALLLVAAGLWPSGRRFDWPDPWMVVVAALPLALAGSLWLLGQERRSHRDVPRGRVWRSKPTASRSWSLTRASRTSRRAAAWPTPYVSASRLARSPWCTTGSAPNPLAPEFPFTRGLPVPGRARPRERRARRNPSWPNTLSARSGISARKASGPFARRAAA